MRVEIPSTDEKSRFPPWAGTGLGRNPTSVSFRLPSPLEADIGTVSQELAIVVDENGSGRIRGEWIRRVKIIDACGDAVDVQDLISASQRHSWSHTIEQYGRCIAKEGDIGDACAFNNLWRCSVDHRALIAVRSINTGLGFRSDLKTRRQAKVEVAARLDADQVVVRLELVIHKERRITRERVVDKIFSQSEITSSY